LTPLLTGHRPTSSRRRALTGLAALTLTALACSNLLATPEPPPTGPPPSPTAVATGLPASIAPTGQSVYLAPTELPIDFNLAAEEALLIDLYQRVNPAVVFILVTSNLGDSLGSGFVIDAEGHIITNHHVVEGARQIEVDFPSGLKTYARVLGTDQDADIAVVDVDIPPQQLTAIELGDSDAVQVGQRVVAIGNPFGLAGTMTVGIVSGLGRTLSSERNTGDGRFSAPDIIQTDAAINPGNSGGPLLDLQGRVIGVNRAIATDSGVNSGIGFAVAVNTVRRIVPHLIADGRYTYPYLGISSQDEVTLAQQEALGLLRSVGVYVVGVAPDGPAAAAGIRAGFRPTQIDGLLAGGDLIVAIDGRAVVNFNDLISYLVNHSEVGQIVRLTLIRNAETIEVEVPLAARP